QNHTPATSMDYRTLLEDKDIDGIMIATPDHWHAIQAIDACKAGKDVYIEKPLCHTVEEGQAILKAARKYNRVMQVGMQRRSSEHYREVVDYVASGQLGDICLMKAWMCQVRGSIGNPPNTPVPQGVNYDTWLGPAPERPFNKNRFHYTWRFFWDYCNSELGNQGIHMLDINLWALAKMKGLDRCIPSRISGNAGIYWLDDAKEVPDTQVVTYDYDDMMIAWELHSFETHSPLEGTRAGMGFYGTDASVILADGQWKIYEKGSRQGKPFAFQSPAGGSHAQNFMDCMKTRKKPNADIAIGRISTLLCHLGNISQRLKRDITFDAQTETIPNDTEANTMLSKKYRNPYTLPTV
ncbi:gfo/Idh/MocA family oxidoreductase, partial [bacterium]|nr:gfo/Idh/MocA family oxidoreductase [bacterium]